MPSRKSSRLVYWLRREADERARAAVAIGAAQMKHTQMADGYVALIREELGDACFERAKQRTP
jgi:hypothetical protein